MQQVGTISYSDPVIKLLFPTVITQSHIKRPFTSSEIDYVKGLKYTTNISNCVTDNKFVLKDVHMKSIKEFIEHSLKYYINNIINPKHELSIYITQSWVNITEPGQGHNKHVHTNSVLSGVLYLDVLDNIDNITFYKEKFDILNIVPAKYNTLNACSETFPAITGGLLIFPSLLHHEVAKIGLNRKKRISLSFNTFIKGQIGDKTESTWVDI